MAQPTQSAERVDINAAEGAQIVKEAATWKGTTYALIGGDSKKGVSGDCSGSTHEIYTAAGFPYSMRNTASFVEYAISLGLFREIDDKEAKQDGDILHWSSHMAIYATFADDPENATTPRTTNGKAWVQKNNMWTASHTGGPAYGPGKLEYFRTDKPRVFRYRKLQ